MINSLCRLSESDFLSSLTLTVQVKCCIRNFMAQKCKIKCDACLRLAMVSLVITGALLAIPSAMRIYHKNRTYYIIFLTIVVACSLLGLIGLSCKILRVVMIIFCILLALSLVMDAAVLAIDLCSMGTGGNALYDKISGNPGAIVRVNEVGDTVCCLFGDTSKDITGRWTATVIEECCCNTANFDTIESKICSIKTYGNYEYRCQKKMAKTDDYSQEKCRLLKASGSLKLVVDLLLLILAILFLVRTKTLIKR